MRQESRRIADALGSPSIVVEKMIRDYETGIGHVARAVMRRSLEAGTLAPDYIAPPSEIDLRTTHAEGQRLRLRVMRGLAEDFERLARRELGLSLAAGIAFALSWDASFEFAEDAGEAWKGGEA